MLFRSSWADISKVSVEVTAVGSNETELTWVIAGRHGRNEVCIPMGAPGEAELVCAMQRRLPDFDNMAVVEALSSAEVATFVVWEAPAKH